MKLTYPLLLLLAVGTARAAPTRDQELEAEQRSAQGMVKYALRDFDGAISDFKTAYALTQAPALLFNLAQASRLAGRPKDALYFYRTYLRAYPDAPNRTDVELLIETSGPGASDPISPRSVASPAMGRPRVASGRLELGLGVALGASAIALLGGGAALGTAANAASAHIAESSARGVPWTPQLRAEWDSGQRDAAWATALYVVGGAAAITGLVLTVVGARRVVRGGFSAAPGPGGAKVAWTYAF